MDLGFWIYNPLSFLGLKGLKLVIRPQAPRWKYNSIFEKLVGFTSLFGQNDLFFVKKEARILEL